jgi:hypothetical protein
MFFIIFYNLPLFRFYVEIISYLHSSNENTLFLYCLLLPSLLTQGRTAINNSTYKSKLIKSKDTVAPIDKYRLFLLIAIRLT